MRRFQRTRCVLKTRRLAAFLLPTVATIGLNGCGPTKIDDQGNSAAIEGREVQSAPDRPAAAEQTAEYGPSPEWLTESSVNPLNDSVVISARRAFTVNEFKIDLGVTCDQVDGITYRASTFDRNGDAAPLHWLYDSTGARMPVKVRVDEDAAEQWYSEPRRFSNQFSLSIAAADFAQADQLTLAFGLANGDVTLVIDQTASVFREAVRPCLEKVRKREAEIRSRTSQAAEAVEAAAVDSEEENTTTPAGDGL